MKVSYQLHHYRLQPVLRRFTAKGTDIHITGRTWNASNFRSVELSLAPSSIRSLLSYNVIFNYNSDILRILLNFVLKFVDVRAKHFQI